MHIQGVVMHIQGVVMHIQVWSCIFSVVWREHNISKLYGNEGGMVQQGQRLLSDIGKNGFKCILVGTQCLAFHRGNQMIDYPV
jgi:hypothetical protein